MKKFLLILSSATIILSVACSNAETKQIEAAAQGYLDAMGNYQIEEASPYATRQTRENTIPTLKFIKDHADTAYMNSNKPAIITITKTKIISDTSARVYYHKSTPIKEVDDSVTVLLEEGKWLVDEKTNLPNFQSLRQRIKNTPLIDPSKFKVMPLDSIDRSKLPH